MTGGVVEASNGGDFLGSGYLIGSTAGGILGGSVETARSALTRSAAWGRNASIRYAAKAAAPELAGAGIGAYAGYQSSGGDLDTTLLYAGLGNAAGGILSALTVKCFVADTLVHVPNPRSVPQYAHFEGQVPSGEWSRSWLVAGVMGLAAVQLLADERRPARRRNRKRRDDRIPQSGRAGFRMSGANACEPDFENVCDELRLQSYEK